MTDHVIPRPVPTPLSQPFWDAANDCRLVLQRCTDCGAYRWTPQYLCIACQAEGYKWTEVSGRGKVYSATVVWRAPLPAFDPPYMVGVVELDEGPLMLTRFLGEEPRVLPIGTPVEVAFTRLDDEINLYTFKPSV